MNKKNQGMRVGKSELGRSLGAVTFAKIKFAKNLETSQSVAIKVLDKDKILKHKMVQQIKREISMMKLVKHPYIVQLLGVHQKRLKADEARNKRDTKSQKSQSTTCRNRNKYALSCFVDYDLQQY
ncbi:CBL-interacting serine/threonine-protein kinase 3 [Physcomitrium patens]|uniref:CBL-interacting serine/threonine-protein kinase 3 n=1 Tax=Physcomitrium patens TaxID=3218 RepID=UPI003CCD591F